MLDPSELEYAGAILQDETQTDEARALAEELITDHLADVAQTDPSPDVRAEAMQALDESGYELADADPYDQPAYDEQAYQQQMAEATMAAQQRGHEMAQQEQYERDLTQHMEQSVQALEQKLGRPMTEIESARTLAEAGIQHGYGQGEFPDLAAAHETATYHHMEETDKPADRVQSMVENAKALEATPEWDQERIDDTLERIDEGSGNDATRARQELMVAQAEGNVSIPSEE